MAKQCKMVFEGGGIKGVGLIGVAAAFQAAGYEIAAAAGTSAGSIASSLLMSGYTAEEIKDEIIGLDYEQFKEQDFLDRMGVMGKLLSAGLDYGIYSADRFENWIAGLLKKKGVRTFSDVKGKLKVTATDLTAKRLLVLPDDLEIFNIDGSSFPVARAVKMSVSIPLFYKPTRLKDALGYDHLIVDGGVMANYPVRIFDDGGELSDMPVFGVRFQRDRSIHEHPKKHMSMPEYLGAIVTCGLDAHDDANACLPGDSERTVRIPVSIDVGGTKKNVSTTDFDLNATESAALYQNGYDAAKEFLKKWDFQSWERHFREHDGSSGTFGRNTYH